MADQIGALVLGGERGEQERSDWARAASISAELGPS